MTARRKKKVLGPATLEAENFEERATFLLLFYRERLSRFAQTLDVLHGQESKKVRGRVRTTLEEVGEALKTFVERAEDPKRCNHICKSMYFCDLRRGHKGLHREEGLGWD